MSLIFQYNQYNGKLNRLVYLDNNKAELIHSHGLTTLEGMLYGHHYKKTPFEKLPKVYNHFEVRIKGYLIEVK